MSLEFLIFWLRETWSNIRRNRLMSLLAVSTVTIGLFILGAFFLLLTNLNSAVRSETQKLDLRVFLKRDITTKRRDEIVKAANIPQIASLQLVPRSQVLAEMKRDIPQLPMEDFSDDKNNPLSDELRIKLKDPHEIFQVRNYLTSIKGVLKTKTPEEDEVVRGLLKFSRFLTIAGLVALCILGLAILLIIHNAIRLTIFARRREIRIMELVGATPWFIRIPFLLEGVLYGITGAIVAAVVLAPLYGAATRAVTALLPLTFAVTMIQCTAWMLIAGLAFGLLGSWFSLARSWGKAVHI